MKKRLLSVFLCVCMIAGMLPTSALAAGPIEVTDTSAEVGSIPAIIQIHRNTLNNRFFIFISPFGTH